jgi:ferrous iron transport protein A
MMPLNKIKPGDKRIIGEVKGSEKVKKFLYTLGCSEGEEITLISILAGNFIINIKDSRYAIDSSIAKAIQLV